MMCLFADTEIIKQGDDPDCVYVMISGRATVNVTVTYKKFNKVKVKTVSYLLTIFNDIEPNE